MNENYYTILEVSKIATQDDIKASFKKLAVKYHPDKHTGQEDKFKEINEAYSTLSDPDKRNVYDKKFTFSTQFTRWGAAFGKSNTATDFNKQNYKKEPPKGDDLKILHVVSLTDCIFGGTTIIQSKYNARCPLCDGSGAKKQKKCIICNGIGAVKKIINGEYKICDCELCHTTGVIIDDVCHHCTGTGLVSNTQDIVIDIPKGVVSGDYITIKSKGNAGANGGGRGDVVIVFDIIPDTRYHINGKDITMKYEVSAIDLILGSQIDIDTPFGMMTSTIPKGTQPNARIRIKEKGIAGGDLYISFNIIIPTTLSEDEEELYNQLRKIEFSNL